MRIRQSICRGVVPPEDERAVVNIDVSESTSELYRDTTSGKLYTDNTLETAFNATLNEESVQVEALDSNTVTIGTTEFIKLSAGEADVEDSNGNQLLLNEGNIYYLNEGVPESSNMQVTDVTPEPEPTEPTGPTEPTEPTEPSEP